MRDSTKITAQTDSRFLLWKIISHWRKSFWQKCQRTNLFSHIGSRCTKNMFISATMVITTPNDRSPCHRTRYFRNTFIALLLLYHMLGEGPLVFSAMALSPPSTMMTSTRHRQFVPLVRNNYPSLSVYSKGNGNENDESGGENNNNNTTNNTTAATTPLSFIEGAVQSITGDDDYQFGDLSKKALSELTGENLTRRSNDENEIENDYNEETYQFGDITKNLLGKAGKAVSGNENYEFGDITKGVLKDMDSSLQEWRGQALNELPMVLLQETFGKFDNKDRQALIVAIVRLMAIALLNWILVGNLCTSASITVAWTKASWVEAATNPVSSGLFSWNLFRMGIHHHQQQQVFLQTYTLLRIVLDPLFMVLQAAGTVLGIVRYERFVRRIEMGWIPRGLHDKYPLLARVGALGYAFLINTVIGMLLTTLGIGFGTVLGRLRLNSILQ